jgi:hypothetical protein
MSETGWVCGNRHYTRKMGTVGPPALHQELIITDTSGQECPVDAEGEITVGGPQMAIGYLLDDGSIDPVRGKRIKTGDLGIKDAEGFIRVTGRSKEVAHPDGKTVLEEDQSAVGFHLILSGEAEARHGGSVVNTMGPGDYFGEMSLIDGKPRSASVVAKGDLRTLAFPSWNFGRLLDENPDIMKALLVVMSDRIRSLSDAGEPGRG